MAFIEFLNFLKLRYLNNLKAEYITLDGQKKYEASMSMIIEGVKQKTEAGRQIAGTGEIVIPVGLARTLSEDTQSLIGKTATIGYKDKDQKLQTLPLTIVGVATKRLSDQHSIVRRCWNGKSDAFGSKVRRRT